MKNILYLIIGLVLLGGFGYLIWQQTAAMRAQARAERRAASQRRQENYLSAAQGAFNSLTGLFS